MRKSPSVNILCIWKKNIVDLEVDFSVSFGCTKTHLQNLEQSWPIKMYKVQYSPLSKQNVLKYWGVRPKENSEICRSMNKQQEKC